MPPTTTTVDPLARPDKLVSNFDRDSADDFDTTGDDLYRVVMELADLFNYLEGNPLDDPIAAVDLLVAPDYRHRPDVLANFAELSENSWRYADPGVETIGIDIVETDGVTAAVRILDTRGQQTLVDSTGATTKTYPGWGAAIATFTLVRGEDGRWRYADVGEFTLATPEDLAALVPVDWAGRKG